MRLPFSNSKKKGQVWVMDVFFAVFIFFLALVIFEQNQYNITNMNNNNFKNLENEGRLLSETLFSQGFPAQWDSANVVRVGFLDSNFKLDAEKIFLMHSLNYNFSKYLAGISSNYLIYFTDSDGIIYPISGYCYIGEDTGYFSTTSHVFYYGNGSLQDDAIRIGAHIELDPMQFPLDDSIYNTVIIENPGFGNTLAGYYPTLKGFAASGGKVVFIGNVGLGTVDAIAFGHTQENLSTVVFTESQFSLDENDVLNNSGVYNQSVYSLDSSFTGIARYDDGNFSIAKWNVGIGAMYFISSPNLTFYEHGIKHDLNAKIPWVVFDKSNTECDFNYDLIDRSDVFKSTRYVNYKNELIKVNIIVWR